MSAAIHASNISKVYKVYSGPRALLKETLFGRPAHHAIRALQEVSFRVAEGESFGVVGDNGAGKSTLLKILTGTAFPTSGLVEVHGKISALLELGAGFHPDFTGRENIHFNGALMGMSRAEIRERQEEIIRFSELGEFIERPVKTYSSGMYVRLGFAVATGFDPSVLIVDEALAVGDQRFQKKCTDRILEFKRRGGTLLFCSHNLYQVKRLCDRAIWLRKGRAEALGEATEVVDRYTDYARGAEQGDRNSVPGVPAQLRGAQDGEQSRRNPFCWIERVRLCDPNGETRHQFRVGETLSLEVGAYFGPEFSGTPGIVVSLIRNDGVVVYVVSSTMEGIELSRVTPHHYHAKIVFPEIGLLSGQYHFAVGTTDEDNVQAYDIVLKAEPFTVFTSDLDYGLIRLKHHWIAG